MTLNHFIKQYDKTDAVILLEGKRTVLKEDQDKLEQLGYLLASKTTKMTFRSGNASGADLYFSKGISKIDPSRLQVVMPYKGHRTKQQQTPNAIALEMVDLPQEPELVKQSKANKQMEKLVERYVSGIRDRLTIKAAYIIRDTLKAIGTTHIKPTTFGIFYDDLQHPKQGGTGHTMIVCENNNIPIINQDIWFSWIED